MSTICATKRDLERIAKKRYVFDERLFNVYIISKGDTALNKGQEYSIKKEGDYYYLYNLLSNTGCYLDPLKPFDIVCEEFEVLITNDVVSKPARGMLLLKNHLYDKTVTKDEVESSDCTIKPEFKDIVSGFTDNRIIQELYIGEPIDVSVWYDGRYLDISRINKSFFLPTKNDDNYDGVADRTVSDNYTNIQLKDLARSTFTCKVGDYLKIENISEKTVVLQKLLSYDSDSELLITNQILSPNEYFDFAVREDCFVVFNILNLQGTLDGYWLTSSCPSDYNFKLTANGYDITNTKKFVSKNQVVSLLASISNYYILDDKEGYYLNDGSGDKILHQVSITFKITKPDGSLAVTNEYGLPPSFSTTSFNDNQFTANVGLFTPDSDCHVEVAVRFITDSEDIELENDSGSNPGYTLYIKGNVPITINNKTYSSESSDLFDSGSNITASWNLDSESYDVLLQYYTSKYYLKNYLTESKSISFDMVSDLILTVNTVSADCIYEADKKVILQLDFESGNFVKLHKSFNYNKIHIIDTENQVYSSSTPNAFLNTDIKSISYYTDKDLFAVTSSAFKDCSQLNTVSIEGPQLQINNSAFKNTTALNEVKGIGNTSFLGNLAFYNSGLKSFHSNNAGLTTINLSAFEECERLLKVLLNELKLASIRESAFKNTPSLKLVKLPKSINSIEKEAFAYSGINKIVTSDLHSLATDGFWFVTNDKTNGLSVIKEGVFKGCTNLKDIELPDSIEHLETLSFAECNSIQNFSSPGLKTIALGAFKDTWVEGIKIDSSFQEVMTSPGYSGALYKKSGTSGILFDYAGVGTGGLNKNYTIATYIKPDKNSDELILYKCNSVQKGLTSSGTKYPIRPETYSISPKAFYSVGTKSDSYAFESIGWYDNSILNKSLIGEKCFMGNQHLTQFTFPNTEVFLSGESIFQNCTNLNLIFTRGCKVPVIPNNTFKDCVSLIPPDFTDLKVESIGDYAFDGSIRHAFDKYNNLCWIQNIVLLVAAVGYTFYTMSAVASTIENKPNSDLPKTHDKVKLSGSKVEHRGIEDFLDGPNEFDSVEEANSAAINALDKMSDYATTHDGRDIFHPNADPNKFTPGEEYVTKQYRDYVGVDYDIQKSVDGHFYIVSPIRLLVRTFVSRTIKKKIWSYIKQAFAKVAKFFEQAAPYIASVSSALGFGKFLDTIRDLTWQAYDYPMGDAILDLPSYSQAVQSGVGLYPDRGVYDVIFPNTIAHIGKYAFRNCKDLKSVSFLQCPAIINEGTFYGCEFLSNVAIVKETVQDGQLGVEEDLCGYCIDIIRKHAFYNCNLFPASINKLIEHVEIIEPYAFAKNNKVINYLQFDPTIEDLRKRSNNQMLVINSDTKQIGDYAFAGANFILFDSDSPELFNISSLAFNPIHDDGYNEYLGAMSRVFAVPLEYVNQYKQRFEELNLSYDYMVTYSNDDYRLLEFV